MKAKVEEVQEKTANVETKKKVLVEISPDPEIYSPAGNTIMNEMLTMINAENIVADLEGWIQNGSGRNRQTQSGCHLDNLRRLYTGCRRT